VTKINLGHKIIERTLLDCINSLPIVHVQLGHVYLPYTVFYVYIFNLRLVVHLQDVQTALYRC
jgi:hypothetical protein